MPIYFKSPGTGQRGERSATAHAASLMLARQHPVSLSPLSLVSVFASVVRLRHVSGIILHRYNNLAEESDFLNELHTVL